MREVLKTNDNDKITQLLSEYRTEALKRDTSSYYANLVEAESVEIREADEGWKVV